MAPAEELQSHAWVPGPPQSHGACLVIEPRKASPSVRNLCDGISGALSGKQLKNQSYNKTFRPASLSLVASHTLLSALLPLPC